MKEELSFFGFVAGLGLVIAFVSILLLTPSEQTKVKNAVERRLDASDSPVTGGDSDYEKKKRDQWQQEQKAIEAGNKIAVAAVLLALVAVPLLLVVYCYERHRHLGRRGIW